jgi:DNA repair exonuclease SbcCD nuclease subunit
MKLHFLHLSDIHLRPTQAENPVMLHLDKIAEAVSELVTDSVGCFVIISGDIAYSGIGQEYAQAQVFLTKLIFELRKTFKESPIHVILVPGNHDCDFSTENQTRAILLDHINEEESIDESIISNCTLHQKDFFDFVNSLNYGNEPREGSKPWIFCRKDFDIDGKKLVFNLFNSSWCSRLEEQPGKLIIPTSIMKEIGEAEATSNLVLSVIHHRQNWFEPANARKFFGRIEETSDIVITGHEHFAAAYTKKKISGEANGYIEGGVLQGTDDENQSSFNVVVVDIDQEKQRHIIFRWDEAKRCYSQYQASPLISFLRNEKRLKDNFPLTEEFSSLLEDPGANFTHPMKDPIRLRDLFIYPNLRAISRKKGDAQDKVIEGDEILKYILDNHKVLIIGSEKTGKTALAKILFGDLHEKVKLPLLVEGDKFTSSKEKSWMKVLRDSVSKTYRGNIKEVYWQKSKTRGVLIIDDYEKVKLSKPAREKLLTGLVDRFESVVLMGSDEVRFEQIADYDRSFQIMWEFQHMEILPFGHVLRDRLIQKWYYLGRSETEDPDAIYIKSVHVKGLVDNILGKNLVPAIPIFILIILQSLEVSATVNPNVGSYGYLYEVLVTVRLAKHFRDPMKLDLAYTYLEELAYKLFVEKLHMVDDQQAMRWHSQYCSEYHMSFSYESIRDRLKKSGLLDYSNGHISFKYNYLYCFFVARYLCNHIDEPEVLAIVEDLSERLYHEESANIVMFLCHLSKDTRIMQNVLKTADQLFSERPICDLDKHVRFLNELGADIPSPVLEDPAPKKSREKILEHMDQIEKREGCEIEEESEAVIDTASEINSAFKTIRILGQILRNFGARLKGDFKLRVANTCFSLGLRALSELFTTLEKNREELAAGIVQAIERKSPQLDIKTKEENANMFFFALTEVLTLATIKYMSDSVGMEDLSETFEKWVESDRTISRRIIGLSIELDHYQHFPQNKAIALAEELHRNYFSLSLVRHLVWMYFYIFPCNYKIRQSVCNKLGIHLRGSSFLDPRLKKLK